MLEKKETVRLSFGRGGRRKGYNRKDGFFKEIVK